MPRPEKPTGWHEVQKGQMIGEEFIQFLEIGTVAVVLVLLLQSIH
jgi:hypothetical protein